MNGNSSASAFQPFIEKFGGINKTCKHIAKRLNNEWTWKYLYHVYRGTVQPSQKLIRKLKALCPPEPTRKRNRKIIEATSKEQLDRWNTLTPDELRQGLDNQVKGI